MYVAFMKSFKDRCRDLLTLHDANPKARPDCSDGGASVGGGQGREYCQRVLNAGLIVIGPRDASGVFASPEPMSEGIVDAE
ncbi:Hypothetical protein PHPALM_7575 [Phytophthora palmivora]|uniref:Uncharacterized protein n=1 Tax=Phytophthora palmivora TaxID=4796 RepID=A0A2P4YBY9_9STRA|nr:Hypothetical protein PHPALM_7575 [Phytophthora palmivora]